MSAGRPSVWAWLKYGASKTFGVVILIALAIGAFRSIKTGDWQGLMPCFGYPLLILTLPLLLVLFVHRQWWVVPGGLIRRDYRLWRKWMEGGYLRAADSVLFVDFRTRMVYVSKDGRLWRIKGDKFYVPGMLAGWLSGARPPSEEEVRVFLDPDGIGSN